MFHRLTNIFVIRLLLRMYVNIPWDFSCGIDILDRNRIYINLKCSNKDFFSVSLFTYYDIFINNVPIHFEATPTRAGVYEF